jgi:hypothetical protein
MLSVAPQPRLHRLLLLGTCELMLRPLRLLARWLGWLLLGVALIGVPAWMIQLIISLLGDGGGGGPLPAWTMVLLLVAAIPAGLAALRVGTIAGPLSRAGGERGTTPDGSRDDADRDDENEGDAESVSSALTGSAPALAWAYQELELDAAASAADIKAAYRRLARTYHPDRNPGFAQQAAERFAAMHAAYEALLQDRGTLD